MEYDFKMISQTSDIESDCLIVPVFDGEAQTAIFQDLDQATDKALSAFLEKGDFNGEAKQFQMLYDLSGAPCDRIAFIGLGKREKLDAQGLALAHATAAKMLLDTQINSVASGIHEAGAEVSALTIRNAVLAVSDSTYRFDQFKSKAKDAPSLTQWTFVQIDGDDFSQAIEQGSSIAAGASLTRDLANSPGNVCTPTHLAEVANDLAKENTKASIEVLEEKDMEALGMGSFMSVSKGSDEPGKMIVLQYQGADKEEQPIVLVGKGITFDTGGISLKPGAKMDEMKFDMGGAASVLGAFKACCDMDLPLNLVVIVAAAENMPSGRASKPGDIVTSMSGQTIEILNTDAEGRLVLCDALTYAARFKPKAMIDVATLTGACIIALGHHTSALMSHDDDLAAALIAAGDEALDPAWRLPLGKKYDEQLKSPFADMGNIGGAPAGSITAACFLARFTKDQPWAHLDIAGTAWVSGSQKASTGRPVMLFAQYLLNLVQSA